MASKSEYERFYENVRQQVELEGEDISKQMDKFMGDRSPTKPQIDAVIIQHTKKQAEEFNAEGNKVQTINRASIDDDNVVYRNRDTKVRTSQGLVDIDRVSGVTRDKHGNKMVMGEDGKFIGALE